MAHVITFGFDPLNQEPIDARQIISTGTPYDNTNGVPDNVDMFAIHEGMQVYSEGQQKLWIYTSPSLTNAEIIKEANWLEITSHNGETLALDPNLTKVFSESESTISPVDFGEDGFVAWDDITNTLTYFDAADTKSILSITSSDISDVDAFSQSGTYADLRAQSTTQGDVGLGLVENTALSTWPGTTNITTLGTIGTGTWTATDVAIAHGGTGASTAGDALQNLGVFDGTLTQNFVNTASTPGRVFVSFGPGDNSGQITVSSITTTELDYLNDVTSNIQDQLDAKEDNLPDATGTQFFRAVGSTEAWHTLVFADATDNPFEIITGGVVLNDDFLDIFSVDNAIANGDNVGTIRFSGSSSDQLSGKATYGAIHGRAADIDVASLDGEVVIGLAIDKQALGTTQDALIVAAGNSELNSALTINNTLSSQQKSLQVNGGDIDFSHTQGVRFLTENTEGGGDSDAVIGEHVFITGSQIVLDDFDATVDDTPVETLAATLPIGSIGVYNGTGTDYTPGGDNGNLQSDVAWASMTQIRARGETASNALIGTTAAQDGDVYIYMSNPSNNNHGVFIRATVTNLDDTLTDDSITVVTIQEIIAERGDSFIETGDGNYNSKLDNSLTITGLSWAHYVNDDTDFEYAIIHASGPGTDAVDKRGRIEIAVANDLVDAGTPGQAAKPIGGNGASIILSGGDATYRGDATFSNAVILSGVADGTAGVVGIDTAGNLSRVVGGGGGGTPGDGLITLQEASGKTGLEISNGTFNLNDSDPTVVTIELDDNLDNFSQLLTSGQAYVTPASNNNPSFALTSAHATNPFDLVLDWEGSGVGDGTDITEIDLRAANLTYASMIGHIITDGGSSQTAARGRLDLRVAGGVSIPTTVLSLASTFSEFSTVVGVAKFAAVAGLDNLNLDATQQGAIGYVSADGSLYAHKNPPGSDLELDWYKLIDESHLAVTNSILQSVDGNPLPWQIIGSNSGIEWSASDPYVHIDNTNTSIADGGTIGSISISDPDNEWFNINGSKVTIVGDTPEHGSLALSAWDGTNVSDVIVASGVGDLSFPQLGAGYLQTDSNGVVSLVTDTIAFENTGTDLGSITTVNFTGDGVTATVNSGDSSQIDVSINAGSFGGILQDTPLSLVDNTDAGVVGEHDDAIQFFAKNATSGSSALIYSSIVGYNEDITDGSEKGAISFKTLDGSLNEVFRIGSESSHFGTIPSSPIDSFTDAEALHRFDTRGSTVNLLHQYNYYDALNEQVEYIIRDADFTDEIAADVKASVSSGETVINKEYHLPYNHKDINDNIGLNVTQALNHSVAYIQDPSTDANPQWWYEVAYRGQRRNRDQGKDGLGEDVQFFQSSPVETVIRTDDVDEAKLQVKAGASFFVTYTEIINGGWLKTGANDSGTTTTHADDLLARSFLRYGYNDGKEYFRVFADSADTSTTFGATVGDETLLCAEQIWSNSNNNTHELVAFKIATGQSNND